VKTNSKLILPVLAVVQIINLQTLRALVPSCSVILPTTSSTSLSLSPTQHVLYCTPTYLCPVSTSRMLDFGRQASIRQPLKQRRNTRVRKGKQAFHTSALTRVRKGKQAFNTSALSNKRMVGWVQRSMLQTRLVSQAHAHLATSNFRAGR